MKKWSYIKRICEVQDFTRKTEKEKIHKNANCL